MKTLISFVQKKWRYYTSMFMLGFGTAMTSPVIYAAQGFGDIGNNIDSNFTGLTNALKAIAVFTGIAMVVVGLAQIISANKRHESPVGGIVMVIIGAALASLTAVISSGSTTLFGSDSTELDVLK